MTLQWRWNRFEEFLGIWKWCQESQYYAVESSSKLDMASELILLPANRKLVTPSSQLERKLISSRNCKLRNQCLEVYTLTIETKQPYIAKLSHHEGSLAVHSLLFLLLKICFVCSFFSFSSKLEPNWLQVQEE